MVIRTSAARIIVANMALTALKIYVTTVHFLEVGHARLCENKVNIRFEKENKNIIHFGCTDWPVFNPKNNLHIQLSEYTNTIEGFDIDVEGLDLEVLKTNDWNKYRPKVVVVESDISIKQDVKSEITQYLELQNYRLIGKSNINGDLGNLFFLSN